MAETFSFLALTGTVANAHDSNGLADPYVKIGSVDKNTGKIDWFFKTPVKSKTLKPDWDYKASHKLNLNDISGLKIDMYDSDIIGKDDFIGTAAIDLITLETLTPQGKALTYHLFNENCEEPHRPSATLYLGLYRK